jgi:hypothetical protein
MANLADFIKYRKGDSSLIIPMNNDEIEEEA